MQVEIELAAQEPDPDAVMDEVPEAEGFGLDGLDVGFEPAVDSDLASLH